jgi:hypothetical protein
MTDTREQQINQAWRQHREYMRASEGNGVTARKSRGVTEGNRKDGQDQNN